MLRMADLSEENWGCQLSQTVSETEDETTSGEHAVVCTESTQQGTDDHENTTNDNGDTTTESISKRGAAF